MQASFHLFRPKHEHVTKLTTKFLGRPLVMKAPLIAVSERHIPKCMHCFPLVKVEDRGQLKHLVRVGVIALCHLIVNVGRASVKRVVLRLIRPVIAHDVASPKDSKNPHGVPLSVCRHCGAFHILTLRRFVQLVNPFQRDA